MPNKRHRAPWTKLGPPRAPTAEPLPPIPREQRDWSPLQSDIFRFVEAGDGHACVEAVAGSGKTTTIVEAANRLPRECASLFLAFNKSIAEELGRRLPLNVEAKTLNSLGHRAWSRFTGSKRLKLDTGKTRGIMFDLLTEGEYKVFGGGVAKLVSMCKSFGIVPKGTGLKVEGIEPDEPETYLSLIDQFDIDMIERDRDPRRRQPKPGEEGYQDPTPAELEYPIELARKVLRQSIADAWHTIDFDDQIYMTVIAQVPMTKYDFIFVDEAQDLNVMQRKMVEMSLKRTGRLVAVGDPRQAIYGFRGADCKSMQNIREHFSTTTLPLSISYRCPVAIVTEAQRFVSHIQSHPSAPPGIVERLETFTPFDFNDEDAILCRLTRPLIGLAFTLIRNDVRCRVLGRDIGAGLQALVKKMDAYTVEELVDRLHRYEARETEALMKKGKEEKAQALTDKIDTLFIFIDALPEGNRTIEALNQKIDWLFSDNGDNCLTLSTVHKAKGREWPRVFILNEYLMPCKWARQGWQQEQEVNLQYVAVTRAKQELYYIDDKGFRAR